MSKEYIEREATCKDCFHYDVCANPCTKYYYRVPCRKFVNSADVEPVVHGEWINNNNGTFTCSACGGRASKMKYCGNCGAKMDGGK